MTSKTLQPEQQKRLRRMSDNKDFTTKKILTITSLVPQRAVVPQRVRTRIKQLNRYLK